MKKPFLLLTLFLFLLAPLTFSQVNLDFTMNLEKEIYYPNEEIEVEINVINRDFQFGAKDAVLSMQIGDRSYDFELGDIKPDAKFTEVVKLPQFTPGSKTIKGTLNYTFFGERWSKETYNGFEVAYPPIERYPRNVNVIGFDLPDKLIAGKEYNVTVTVKNEGSVGGDMLVEVASLEEFVDKEIKLEPGETETIGLTIKFINPEVSLIEARIYALINGEKYLLAYSGKKAYLEEEKKAKLSIDKLAYVDESDKEINQKDEVNIKIYLKNDGNYAAAEVTGTLSCSDEKINVTKPTLNYVLIPAGGVSAPENEYFRIETDDAEVGKHSLNLEVSYLDSEQRKKVFNFSVTVEEGSDSCSENDECDEDSVCLDNQCQTLECPCGYAEDHKCIRYECCSDSDCGGIGICNEEKHVCEIPSDLTRDVLIVTVGSRLDKTDGFNEAISNYRNTIEQEGLSSAYLELDSPVTKSLFNVELINSDDWINVRSVLHKILYKTKSKYLLILGGHGIIPQPPAKTTAEIPAIPVDDGRYIDFDSDGLPDIAVGRMPIPQKSKSVNIIIDQLKSAIETHKKEKINLKYIVASPCGTYSSEKKCIGGRYIDNNLISQIIFGRDCNQEGDSDCKIPTDFCLEFGCSNKEEFKKILESADFLYFGCHGSGYSYGYQHKASTGTILTGRDLYSLNLNHPLVVSTACHGSTIDDEEGYDYSKDATGISFSANGGILIGNTRYGYRHASPERYATILERIYSGKRIGEAIKEMKREWITKAYHENSLATTYEIQLYGDPTLKINMG